ncbi:MAG: hypothetical protein QM731_27525 [Chitinophagaceae bacterium]
MRTLLRYTLFLLIAIACYSCEEGKKPKTKAAPGKKKAEAKVAVASDTLIIRTRTAVAYAPDNAIIEKRKKEIGAKNFQVGADDYLYYMKYSGEFLKKVKLPVQQVGKQQYLKFVQDDNSYTIIKKDTASDLWGIYFFTPSKKPLLADITSIEKEYKVYFK